MLYVQFFFCGGPSEVWWGLVLDAEMTDLIVKCLLCPWLSRCLIGLYHYPNQQGYILYPQTSCIKPKVPPFTFEEEVNFYLFTIEHPNPLCAFRGNFMVVLNQVVPNPNYNLLQKKYVFSFVSSSHLSNRFDGSKNLEQLGH